MAQQELSFNRLKNENSLYLSQYKDSPIHWYPYGEEALQKAKELDRPILLSIGYSTCRWCHVMGQESFQDEATADYLNKNFICIKVDKDEHPDIDSYYQQACQLFTKSGGWPLNAFLLPDTAPFFVGTYYPKDKRGDEATFMELLNELSRAYHGEKEQVKQNAENITSTIKEGFKVQKEIEFQGHFPHPMSVFDALKDHTDEENGGFKGLPKFPHYSFYEWSVEQLLEGMLERQVGDKVIKTIDAMLFGGLYDHVRGGVHRYSNDEKFLVPHFEKALYDQAAFLSLMAKTSKIYQAPHVFDAIMDTLEYLQVEMQSDDGFFFSAQASDSEGVEGLYFTFTKEEFEEIINQASNDDDDLTGEMDYWLNAFQITENGNFERGLNVISLDISKKEELFAPETWEKVRRIRKQIASNRKTRIPPVTDSKGITSWNAVLISSLIDVMQYCPIDPIKFKANTIFQKTTEGFFKTFLRRKENNKVELRHCTSLDDNIAFLEDYVFFAQAQLRIFEVTGNHIFKSNFKDILNFITEDFVKDDRLMTRSIPSENFRPYPNQQSSPFDNSFKSPVITALNLIKRARLLFLDPSIGENLEPLFDWSKQMALLNPIASGAGLRVNTYPDAIYRKIVVPKSWLENNSFVTFIGNLMSRFVIDFYEDEKETGWQIYTIEKCELQGDSYESFEKSLTPPEESEQKDV